MLFASTPYYLDAGTGSMLVQMVVAGVAGVAVFLKVFWAKVTAPFRRGRTDSAETDRLDAKTPGSDD